MAKQWDIVVKCQMEVRLSVEAETEEEVHQWIASRDPSVYSAIETPVHEASDITLENVTQNFSRGYCPDVVLPIADRWGY